MAHAGIEVGFAAEETDAHAGLAGTQVGHDGEEFALAEVGEDLAQRGAGAAFDQFDAGGVSQTLEEVLYQGVFLHAGQGEHSDTQGRNDDAGEFPVAHVGTGEDGAASGMRVGIGPDSIQGVLHVDGDWQLARTSATHIQDFREVEGHVAKGLPGDGMGTAGRAGIAQNGADAADGLAPARTAEGETQAGQTGGQQQGKAIRQPGDHGAKGAEQPVFGAVLEAVLHGWDSGDTRRGGMRRASSGSVQAWGRKRTAISASGADRVTR